MSPFNIPLEAKETVDRFKRTKGGGERAPTPIHSRIKPGCRLVTLIAFTAYYALTVRLIQKVHKN